MCRKWNAPPINAFLALLFPRQASNGVDDGASGEETESDREIAQRANAKAVREGRLFFSMIHPLRKRLPRVPRIVSSWMPLSIAADSVP